MRQQEVESNASPGAMSSSPVQRNRSRFAHRRGGPRPQVTLLLCGMLEALYLSFSIPALPPVEGGGDARTVPRRDKLHIEAEAAILAMRFSRTTSPEAALRDFDNCC